MEFYAVLGVVTQIAGGLTRFAVLLAGITAICLGYSSIELNTLVTDKEGENGGRSVTFVRAFTGNSSLAGMVDWTLLVGYTESMAMYAFAFGEFTLALPFVPESLGGLPL
ncbi:hypothetical protein [Haladaptatus salinisoli]|uniref:hypothetical protein n=1 Tax=Haladaptatus salinisoli TaxID=2884876 RepID=UPI001D0A4EAC|nr:hypothetical protein [Haladaptatus salinisoli]